VERIKKKEKSVHYIFFFGDFAIVEYGSSTVLLVPRRKEKKRKKITSENTFYKDGYTFFILQQSITSR